MWSLHLRLHYTECVTVMYRTNDNGDVYLWFEEDRWQLFEPERFGWASPGGKTTPEMRRSLDQLQTLPGFTVVVEPGPSHVPGPRPNRSVPWQSWSPGAAPPAAAESKGGVSGTLAYSDRLTDALGLVAQRLPAAPERSPFVVHDFVGGRQFWITYTPEPLGPGGEGLVYVLDDGHAFKIGHTTGHVAVRVAGLQTGNPRLIQTVATVGPATDAVEAHLHTQFGAWSLRGEWFLRAEVAALVESSGGWEPFLRSHLPDGDWIVTQYPAADAT